MPDPSNPQPTPDNPNPAPARPASPPEEPPTHEPPGVPSPSPDPVPSPDEPVQIPPWMPPEIPPTPGFPAPTAREGTDLADIARAFAFALFVSLPLLASPAAAQPSDSGNGQLVDPCQAKPQEDQEQQLRAAGQLPDDVLSGSLERCHGVLKPPPTGDNEIVEPAPDTGTTPIIPPGSLPEQPPK